MCGQLAGDVAAVSSIEEIIDVARASYREYRAHRRMRSLYSHVQNDIDGFARRVDRLDQAINRADVARVDVTAASVESGDATDGVESAHVTLDAIGPSVTGGGIMDALDLSAALDAPTPIAADSAQGFPFSDGSGSLEAARGTNHVYDEGVALGGEIDILSSPWTGYQCSTEYVRIDKVKTAIVTCDSLWDGGIFNGASWSGASWSSAS